MIIGMILIIIINIIFFKIFLRNLLGVIRRSILTSLCYDAFIWRFVNNNFFWFIKINLDVLFFVFMESWYLLCFPELSFVIVNKFGFDICLLVKMFTLLINKTWLKIQVVFYYLLSGFYLFLPKWFHLIDSFFWNIETVLSDNVLDFPGVLVNIFQKMVDLFARLGHPRFWAILAIIKLHNFVFHFKFLARW